MTERVKEQRRYLAAVLAGVDGVAERYPGYRRDMQDTLTEIIKAERKHRSQKTNIVQQIGNQIDALGLLLEKRAKDGEGAE